MVGVQNAVELNICLNFVQLYLDVMVLETIPVVSQVGVET